MSIIHGLASLRDDELRDPRETQDFRRPEIEKLFALALEGKLPRSRPLKPWEPQKLNERHIVMITMRAGGLHQRQIAHAIDDTEARVSIVLNHPDAELLLAKLQAMKAMEPSSIEMRLAALSEPALGTLERLFDDSSEVSDLKRAPMAFKLLELNGHGAKKKVEHSHSHELRAAPEQLDRLTTALRESRSIEQGQVLNVTTFRPGEACSHPGCLSHVTHPCEGCGRIAGQYPLPPQGQELAPAAAPSSGDSGEDGSS